MLSRLKIFLIAPIKQVQPGEHFKLIGVADLENIPLIPGGIPAYEKDGLRSKRDIQNVEIFKQGMDKIRKSKYPPGSPVNLYRERSA